MNLAKGGMVVKSKKRRRTAEHFKKFPQLLRLKINVNKNAALERKGTEIATFLPIVTKQFCLLSYWLTAGVWAFHSVFLIPSKNCPEAFQ